MATVQCTECGGDLTVEANAVVGEILVCPECGAEQELVSTKPPKVELAPEVREDWGE